MNIIKVPKNTDMWIKERILKRQQDLGFQNVAIVEDENTPNLIEVW